MGATKTALKYPKKTYIDWYTLMLRIRRLEEKTLQMYGMQKIRGFCHVYIGQEAVAAGIMSAIRPEDSMITAYRVHGLALAKGIPAREIMAELFGKVTGNVKGQGGSMHFFSKEHHFYGGNGIVGAQIPQGAGIALAEKYKGTDNVCITMFGDGAARQGSLFESFNMAMTWKLPVIFVCENNGYAMGTSVKRTSNVEEIYRIGEAFDMPSEPVDGMNPEAVHEAFDRALKYVRSGKGPYFLEVNTYRYKGHSVSDPAKYRSKDELKAFMDKDPVKMAEAIMLENKIITEDGLKKIKASVKDEIEDAVKFAEDSPMPEGKDLYKYNYVQEDYPYIKE